MAQFNNLKSKFFICVILGLFEPLRCIPIEIYHEGNDCGCTAHTKYATYPGVITSTILDMAALELLNHAPKRTVLDFSVEKPISIPIIKPIDKISPYKIAIEKPMLPPTAEEKIDFLDYKIEVPVPLPPPAPLPIIKTTTIDRVLISAKDCNHQHLHTSTPRRTTCALHGTPGCSCNQHYRLPVNYLSNHKSEIFDRAYTSLQKRSINDNNNNKMKTKRNIFETDALQFMPEVRNPLKYKNFCPSCGELNKYRSQVRPINQHEQMFYYNPEIQYSPYFLNFDEHNQYNSQSYKNYNPLFDDYNRQDIDIPEFIKHVMHDHHDFVEITDHGKGVLYAPISEQTHDAIEFGGLLLQHAGKGIQTSRFIRADSDN